MTYAPVRRLSSGYFGEVWLENDKGLKRQCASKRMPSGMLGPDDFAEARTMAGVQHAHIVEVYSVEIEDYFDANGDPQHGPVIRMEYCKSGSVADEADGKPVDVLRAMDIVSEATLGVEALHAKQVLHRDIKPGNLLIGDDGKVKVSDFGLSCKVTDIASAPDFAYPVHLPPESLGPGGVGCITTIQGDLYALGVTLFRLLNGDDLLMNALPSEELLDDMIRRGKFPDRDNMQPYIHPKLGRVLRKVLHTDPARRYQTVADLRHDLARAKPVVSWKPDGDGYIAFDSMTGAVRYQLTLSASDTETTLTVFRAAKAGSKLRRHLTRSGSAKAMQKLTADVMQLAAETGVLPK